MRSTSLWILVLAVVAGACSDDGGPRVLDPDALRVVKVAGDGQVEPVASTAPSAVAIPAGLSAQVSGTGDLFEEVLVVRLAEEGKMTLSGATVRPGTMIHWEVRGEGCGRPVGGSTAVDDSAYSINRWRKGTKAGECLMDACRILSDGTVECDETFVAIQEPGPVANLQWHGPAWLCTGDEVNLLDLISRARDAHNNDIDLGTLGEDLGAALTWKWLDRVQNSDAVGPEGSGLEVIVPDLSEYNFWPLTQIGYFGDPDRTYYAGGLRVWLNGHDTGYALAAQVFAKGHCPR